MNQAGSSLPSGFAALEPFVAEWALASANDRLRARLSSEEGSRVAFFEACKPLAAPALERLDAKPLHSLDEQERTLMRLLLSFAHVSLAVEVQGSDEPMHASDARFITITRAPADL